MRAPLECATLGDRIVSVNGQTIFGKSYDQVVQLIQRTEDKLSLEVSPKHYDTLQLVRFDYTPKHFCFIFFFLKYTKVNSALFVLISREI